MRIIDDTIIFKSANVYYYKEKSGLKPNTVRLIQEGSEVEEFIPWAYPPDWPHSPKRYIQIENVHDATICFSREVTDVSTIASLLGYRIFVISWKHPEKEERV